MTGWKDEGLYGPGDPGEIPMRERREDPSPAFFLGIAVVIWMVFLLALLLAWWL